MTKSGRMILTLVVVALLFAGSALADEVTGWNEAALQAIRVDRTPPPRAARALAMVHEAIWVAVERVPRPTRSSGNSGPASIDAAVAIAAHDVLLTLFPGQAAVFEGHLAATLERIAEGPAKRNGIAVGREACAEVLLSRGGDGSDDVVVYTPGDAPGQWRPTPPAFLPALLPQWGSVRPFVLPEPSYFRPPPPPPLTGAPYARQLEEVRRLGSAESSARTPEETEIALFWADGPGTATPPGHWNAIALQLSQEYHLTPVENARLFALLNFALADAGIAAWDAKYADSCWRPVTAIREADLDGNPRTASDPGWTPLIVTPPFPSYVSGHSTFSGAAAQVLARFFDRDDVPFTIGSDAMPGVIRSFAGFSEAAAEAGRSRIFGGIHFAFDDTRGRSLGRAIGNYVWDTMAPPMHVSAPR